MNEAPGPGQVNVEPREQAQCRLVLTAHELQRVGAFALADLSGESVADPERLSQTGFRAAVERMTRDAVATARVASTTAEDGFWLKVSGSLFPNAPMNHPSRLKNGVEALAAEIRAWRTRPEVSAWPGAPCALCGREAVGFYGKRDVPLAESDSYRNTTPRGHAGLALCWPCLCCFYALPYGCRLTGGPSTALHSWDDRFTAKVVARRVAEVGATQAIGVPPPRAREYASEVEALERLRSYDQEVRAGVELIVFSNNNQQQSLVRHGLDQPLARWLQASMRDAAGFGALVAAHRSAKRAGHVELARVVFRAPRQIVARVAGYVKRHATVSGALAERVVALGPLYRSYLTGVMGVREHDVDEIDQVGRRVAAIITAAKPDPQQSGGDGSGSLFAQFRAAHRNPSRLRHWLRTQGYQWLLRPPAGAGANTAPLVSKRQFLLLFDPDTDAWLHRELLMVSVVEELHRLGWRPNNPDELAEQPDDDTDDTEPDNTETAAADETFLEGLNIT